MIKDNNSVLDNIMNGVDLPKFDENEKVQYEQKEEDTVKKNQE